MLAMNHLGKIMKKWNDAAVLGNSNLFFHHFTLYHFTKSLNDQTSNAILIYLQLLRLGSWSIQNSAFDLNRGKFGSKLDSLNSQ